MKKLLFITTSSLASNPRLTKELYCLSKHFKCYVISYYHADWSFDLSKKIEQSMPEIKFHTINRTQNRFNKFIFKFIHLIAIKLNYLIRENVYLQALALNDKSLELTIISNKITAKNNFSRIIAHNIGAFYPAYYSSKKHFVDLQIDIEDYHPGEKTYFNHKRDIKNRIDVMQKVIEYSKAITYASKGIYLKCVETFNIPKQQHFEIIINAFSKLDFDYQGLSKSDYINCVWYSQHISHGRGLENIFNAAKKLHNFKFHLIGNKNKNYTSSHSISENIIFHPPMEQKELHRFICSMDIGLALEDSESDANRNICLTNKIISYAQAGIYIFATDTFGQKDFLSSLKYQAGEIISNDLLFSLSHFNKIYLKDKPKRKEHAKSFCWEEESKKLLFLISKN